MYCINPGCPERHQTTVGDRCRACGAPRLFQGYRILRLIEKTQQSEIFEVEAEASGSAAPKIRRIMKVIQADDVARKQVELFDREYTVLTWLNHPNIPHVDLDDYFTVPLPSGRSLSCLVMQKMEGETLDRWVARNGRVSEAIALRWLRQLVAPADDQDPDSVPGVLTYLHQHQIVHRDIKPSNLILQPNGELALIDFGGVRELTMYRESLAAVRSSDRQNATIITSPGYSPPEQVNAQALLISDFYALGRTWVQLLTEQLPIDLIDPQTNRLQWHHRAPQISKPFAQWLDTLMADSPDHRPSTTIVIYETLTYRLPRQIRTSRILNSSLFRLFIAGSAVAFFVAVGYGISFWNSAESLRRGVQNLQAERYQEARTELEAAVRLNDRSTDAHLNLGLACYYLGDDGCAITHYRRVISLEPENWQAYYNLGTVYDRQEKFDLAITQYTKAANGSNEVKAQAITNIARLKNRQQQYAEAESLVRSVIELTEVNLTRASLYKNLGWALFGLKQISEAQAALEKALPLDATRIDTYCLLALVKQARNLDAEAERNTCKFSVSKLPLPEIKEWQKQLDKQKG